MIIVTQRCGVDGQIYNALGLSVGCINHEASYVYDSKHTENPKSEIRNPNKFKIQILKTTKKKIKNAKEDELDKTRDTLGSFKVVHEFLRPCSRQEAYDCDITYGTNNEFGLIICATIWPTRRIRLFSAGITLLSLMKSTLF